MKTVNTYLTYDPYNCASAGHKLELRTDGSIKITLCSRWQGSRTDRIVLTPPGTVTMPSSIGDNTPDADALLASWWEDQQGEEPAGRLLRTGSIVQ